MHHLCNCKSKFWGGVILGAAAAIGASIFFSSEKGQEMKERARQKFLEMKQKMKEKSDEDDFTDFMQEAAKKYAKAKNLTEEEAEDMMKRAKKVWNEIVE